MRQNGLCVWMAVLLWMASVNGWAQTEMDDPYPGDPSAWDRVAKVLVEWGSTDVRYSRSQVPDATSKSLDLTAWRGERVLAQAVIAAPTGVDLASVSVSDLRCGRSVIPASEVSIYKVNYVMADNFARNDSVLVADRLTEEREFGVAAHTTSPVWLNIHIPHAAPAGRYAGTLTVDCDGKKYRLPLKINVLDKTIPEPKDWTFHLDLWQNPYAVARYFGVPLWSPEHFDCMRPLMQTLADAGQKVITCSIIQHPWNSQTHDPFESMVGKTKTIDGQWVYDYSVFDRWVEFMMSLGIDRQIDCYSLLPWHYRFDYYDMASNTVRYVHCQPEDPAYEEFLLPFLRDFAAHLKAKGWWEKTCIAMDERPTEQLRAAYALVKKADAGYRMEGAYNYFPEFYDEVHDISVAYNYDLINEKTLARRHENGNPVTFYTCCVPDRPNTFTFSPTAESAYMGWHAAAVGYDGYLRWAYNSWVERPTVDSRFRSWPSGDCFLVYPDGTSLRMERLVEGIQAFEKVRILRAEGCQEIEQVLEPFRATSMPADVDVAAMIRQATEQLNRLAQ